MEDITNFTIDPACLGEPPLAMDVIKGKFFLSHHLMPYQPV